MASRSRERRNKIPGYDEFRPNREDRKRSHRATRHAANQMLHTIDDYDDAALPTVRKSGLPHTPEEDFVEPTRQKFKVWKTKFWKRRGNYQELKTSLDSNWNETSG